MQFRYGRATVRVSDPAITPLGIKPGKAQGSGEPKSGDLKLTGIVNAPYAKWGGIMHVSM